MRTLECEPFPELTEAKRSRQPVRLKVMTHNRLFVARVHRPHSVSKFGFCFRHACMLSQVLCPIAHQHFCPDAEATQRESIGTEGCAHQTMEQSGEQLRQLEQK